MAASSSGRQLIPVENKFDRVILLIDMDCFYCQVEEKLNPDLRDKPMAVVQYNAWQGGGIIAVNYAARAKGVTRHMRGEEAMQCCPEIALVRVPNVDEKADLSRYREAGGEVAKVLQRYTKLLERASVDEAYLDITSAVDEQLDKFKTSFTELQQQDLDNTFIAGGGDGATFCELVSERLVRCTSGGLELNECSDEQFEAVEDYVSSAEAHLWMDVKLLIGATISSRIRAAVKAETGYECSAGIAHSKLLAKLACGLNKPNKQTIMPVASTRAFFATLPVGKVNGLGGKLGEELCRRLGVRFIGDMLQFSESALQKHFNDKTGSWLYNVCRGIDLEMVVDRTSAKSVGCSKKFPGPTRISGLNTLKHWLEKLAGEVCTRLEQDERTSQRRATQISIGFIQDTGRTEAMLQRSGPLTCYTPSVVAQTCLQLIKANTAKFLADDNENRLNNAITFLGITAGKFVQSTPAQNTLANMFASLAAKNQERGSTGQQLKETVPVGKAQVRSHNTIEVMFSSQTANKSMAKPETTAVFNTEREKPTTAFPAITSKRNAFVEENAESFFANLASAKSNPEPQPQMLLERRELQSPPPCTSESSKSPAKENAHSFFVNCLASAKSKPDPPPQTVVVETAEPPLSKRKLVADESVHGSFFKRVANAVANTESQSQKVAEETRQVQSPSPNRDSNDGAKKLKPNTVAEVQEQLTYQHTYAEFELPAYSTDQLPAIICDICRASIPNDKRALQTHQDYHYAQQLRQRQIEEHQAEICSQSSLNQSKSSSSTANRTRRSISKLKTNESRQIPSGDIKRFLMPTPNTELATVTCNPGDDMVSCVECAATVSRHKLQEHMDAHMARRLQAELNQTTLNAPACQGRRGAANKTGIIQYFTQQS